MAKKEEAPEQDTLVGVDVDPRVEDTAEDDFGNDPVVVEQEVAEAESEAPAVEEAPATEEETPPPKPMQDHRIPKSRFDEVNRRRKEAERRLQELERQQQSRDPSRVVNFDFNAKEKEYMQAVLDGEEDKALAIRNEIRGAEMSLHEMYVQEAQQEAQYKTKAQIELEQTVQEAQQNFPEFDASSEVYDEDITQEALELFAAYQSRGYTPADAMNRAVRLTSRAYGLGQKDAPEPEPAAKPTRPSTLDDKLKTAGKQPPAPSQARDRANMLARDPMQMSEKEFDALDPDEERRLRGDFA